MIGARRFDGVGQCRIDGDAAVGRQLDKTLRELGISGGERGADLALRNVTAKNAIEGLIGDLDRVGRRRVKPRPRLNPAANQRQRGHGERDGAEQRQCRMSQDAQRSVSAHGLFM